MDRQEMLERMAAELADLHDLARWFNEPFLAYIIQMAWIEAERVWADGDRR